MEECRKTSGIQVSAEPLELSVGGVLKLQLLSWVAQGCFGDTHMQAPLVATRAAARPDATTRGHIHPPLDLAPDEIDIHAIANIPRMIARGGMFQRCWSAMLSGCMRRRATPKPIE